MNNKNVCSKATNIKMILLNENMLVNIKIICEQDCITIILYHILNTFNIIM